MQKSKNKFALFVLLMCASLLASACGGVQSATSNSASVAVPPAKPISSDENITEKTIRFLEDRVKRDPEDFSANNKLAGQYLQQLRETGNAQYLDLAFRAARTSLASVPEVRNPGGLAALAQAEFAAHDFANARDHAIRLTELEPGKSYPSRFRVSILPVSTLPR